MRTPETMRRVAQAVVAGGAAGVRAQGIEDIAEMRAHLTVPIIGLVRGGEDAAFFTPPLVSALAWLGAGAASARMVGTRLARRDGRSVAEVIAAVRGAGAAVMVHCAETADVLACAEAGADIIGTTLAGYAPGRPKTPGPDLDFVREAAAAVDVPIMAEGRYHAPADVEAGFAAGAFSVTVGTAITHPATITTWFAAGAARP